VFIGTAVVYMNLAQSVVDMPVMALQFSMFLAFMVYVEQDRRLAKDESKPGEIATAPDVDKSVQPLPAGTG
jgi:hypothetical protein